MQQPFQLKFDEFMKPWSQFYIVKKEVTTTYSLHWHEFCEIEFVYDGKASQIVNGASYSLHKGILYFLSPSDFHEVNIPEGGGMSIYNLMFSEAMVRESLIHEIFHTGENLIVELQGEQFEHMLNCFESLLDEYEDSRPHRETMLTILLEEVLIHLIRMNNINKVDFIKPKGGLWENPAYKALGFIHKNYQQNLTLNDVASQFNVSASYFSRIFSSHIGCSFQTYLQRLRLRAARILLLVSEITINEVCILSGFNTYAHFSRAFRKAFNISPQAFRDKMKQIRNNNI